MKLLPISTTLKRIGGIERPMIIAKITPNKYDDRKLKQENELIQHVALPSDQSKLRGELE
jgi:hypothetical protein